VVAAALRGRARLNQSAHQHVYLQRFPLMPIGFKKVTVLPQKRHIRHVLPNRPQRIVKTLRVLAFFLSDFNLKSSSS
jgi:hypothetical protein